MAKKITQQKKLPKTVSYKYPKYKDTQKLTRRMERLIKGSSSKSRKTKRRK